MTLTFDLTHDLNLGCFTVKFLISFISGIVGLIDLKWKGNELIWFWADCMTLPFDHTHDLDLGVSRSESEIALSQEWGGRLTWSEKDVSHPFKTMILSSLTMVGWADVLDIDRGDFRRRRVVDISGSNWIQFFSPRDLEIWWMTSKNNRVPLLFYIKLCASFLIYWWIQTGVTVRKRSIMVKIGGVFFVVVVVVLFCFFCPVWPWNSRGDLEKQ